MSSAPETEDRIMWVAVNALGQRDALETVQQREGDLDFSGIVKIYTDEDLPPGVDVDSLAREDAVGGYLVKVLRRAYLKPSGQAYDSEIVVLEVSDCLDLFTSPALTTRRPAYPAKLREKSLEKSLEAAAVAPRTPRL